VWCTILSPHSTVSPPFQAQCRAPTRRPPNRHRLRHPLLRIRQCRHRCSRQLVRLRCLKRYFRFFFFFFFFFLNFFFKITAQKSTRKSKLAEHHLHASNIVATPSTTTTTTTTTTTAAAHDDTDTALAIAATSRRKRSLALVRANDPPHETIERRSCNCKNSRCLKLYCECFPAVDHQILTNRGFLLLDQVLSLVHSYCADDGTVAVADWRGLAVASFDPNSCSLVYRTPRRLVVNRASPHGVPVVEFNVPHSGVSIVATQHHALYVAPASSSAPFAKVAVCRRAARRDTVRLLAVASGGVVIDGGVDAWRQMPCIAQLSLATSRAQLVAFLELYGIWLAVGDIDAEAVRFRCAPSLLRARYKRAGLRNGDIDTRAAPCTSALGLICLQSCAIVVASCSTAR
jgi:hypothetical protein